MSEEQFLELVEENEERFHHLCRIYTDRSAEEKDLYQEMLIQVWRAFPSFEDRASIHTWAYRIALNTAISFVRKKRTRRDYHDRYRREEVSRRGRRQTRPGDGESPEHVTTLYDAISHLNPSEKAILSMYLEDFSYAEIAYVTDITENHVGVKLHRIKKKLSKIIEEENGA
ncbi:MAG: sigma-70 family RNA polymerase sigma factor [Balneolaceae bacterium]|nr:sigma-70 family RNA polymerase sigma factor [Balneolaceae bacterium]